MSFLTGATVWHCIAVCRRLAIVQCSALADTYVVISVLEMIFGHAYRGVQCVRYNNICVCVSRFEYSVRFGRIRLGALSIWVTLFRLNFIYYLVCVPFRRVMWQSGGFSSRCMYAKFYSKNVLLHCND